MNPLEDQLARIREKLRKADKADLALKVFGAKSHRYRLNPPVKVSEIEAFEKKYSIKLPASYRAFLTEMGNGGAGPFYGIYPLEKNVNELAYAETSLRNACLLSPRQSEEEWNSLTNQVESDDISEAEYDEELDKIFGGILPIGSQGCTYLHGLILNGPNTGKVVNLDQDFQRPKFTYEDTFLDWYERWLDEIISGDLTGNSTGWFGYNRGGTDAELMAFFLSTADTVEKQEAIGGLLQKKTLDKSTLSLIKQEYGLATDEVRSGLLQLLTKYDYPAAHPLLEEEGKRDLLKTYQLLWWYARSGAGRWKPYIQKHMGRVQDEETLRYCGYLLKEIGGDYGKLILPFASHPESKIRQHAFYMLGKLKNKEAYLPTFLKGLQDPDNWVLHATLQAISDLKNPILLPYYKAIAQRFPEEKDYILSNLEYCLTPFELSLDQIRQLDV